MNQSPPKKSISVRSIARVGVGAVLIASMLVAISTWVSRYLFVGEIFSNFRFQISTLTLIACFVFYSLGSRRLACVGALVSLITFLPVAGNFISPKQPEPGPKTFSLLSYNVYGENSDRAPVVAKILDHVADVVVVLEYENFWEQSLRSLSQSYTYSVKVLRWHGFGIALFSRFPIEDSKILKITKTVTDNPIIVAEIKAGQQSFIVVAAHLLSPLSAQKLEIRNQQIAEVADVVSELRADRELPVLLVGDFNCVAWSPFLQDAMNHCQLRDSRNGFGYQGSWPTRNALMQIPIDHALVSGEIRVHNRSILPPDTSDHFPLYLEFSISENEPAF